MATSLPVQSALIFILSRRREGSREDKQEREQEQEQVRHLGVLSCGLRGASGACGPERSGGGNDLRGGKG
jgi:hypothetical protein